ncbi:hypothetical protein BGZ82_007633 [Podila clonocystis]|nr:hypothetical protein BGZ82_007633 [Podila clonocystis]
MICHQIPINLCRLLLSLTSACISSTLKITLHDKWTGFGYSSDLYKAGGYHSSTPLKLWKKGFESCSENGDYCYTIGHKDSSWHSASLKLYNKWRDYKEPHNDQGNNGVLEYYD